MNTLKKLATSFALVLMALTAQAVEVGETAPNFKLKNVDGKYVSLKDYQNEKGVIVIFTCNHCPFSVAYEDRIIALQKKYKSMGFPVVAINPNDSKDYPADNFANMKIRAKEKDFNFPYLFDAGQKIFPQYGATRTPHVYLLQTSGNQHKVAYIGAIDNNYQDGSKASEKYVENAIDQLLKGQAVAVKETKAIGCSIKN